MLYFGAIARTIIIIMFISTNLLTLSQSCAVFDELDQLVLVDIKANS